MKVWLITLCGLLAFLILSLMIQSYLDQSADFLSRKLSEIEPDIKSLNWNQTDIKLKSFTKDWERTKLYWAVITNHKEMDLIEEALLKTIQAVAGGSYTDALINLSVLKNFIKHIPEKERFSIVNIF